MLNKLYQKILHRDNILELPLFFAMGIAAFVTIGLFTIFYWCWPYYCIGIFVSFILTSRIDFQESWHRYFGLFGCIFWAGYVLFLSPFILYPLVMLHKAMSLAKLPSHPVEYLKNKLPKKTTTKSFATKKWCL